MNIEYYMKLQNAWKTNSHRERDLAKVNRNADKHFDDTFDTEYVQVNNVPMQIMIVKDTDGNVNKKKIKTRHDDIIKLGDYVIWNNQYWLITLLDPDDKTWNRGYMYLCTILLRWQDVDGSIIERWAYSEDYTKYSTGQTGNSTVVVGDYQYGLTVPVDEYTKKLHRGNRFVIDYEGVYPPDTYILAGKKAYLNDNSYFDRGGVITFTMSYNFFNETTDKMIELSNGTSVWICDYYSSIDNNDHPFEISNVTTVISGSNALRLNQKKTWSVSFKKNNELVDIDFSWKVNNDSMVSSVGKNKITLSFTDSDIVGQTITLQVLNEQHDILAEMPITLIDEL